MNSAPQNWDCPALMSDGRLVTNYRPSCESHYYLLDRYNIKNAYDLRLFMQRNAACLRNQDRAFMDAKNSCVSCQPFMHPDPNGNDQYWQMYRKRLGF